MLVTGDLHDRGIAHCRLHMCSWTRTEPEQQQSTYTMWQYLSSSSATHHSTKPQILLRSASQHCATSYRDTSMHSHPHVDRHDHVPQRPMRRAPPGCLVVTCQAPVREEGRVLSDPERPPPKLGAAGVPCLDDEVAGARVPVPPGPLSADVLRVEETVYCRWMRRTIMICTGVCVAVCAAKRTTKRVTLYAHVRDWCVRCTTCCLH